MTTKNYKWNNNDIYFLKKSYNFINVIALFKITAYNIMLDSSVNMVLFYLFPY